MKVTGLSSTGNTCSACPVILYVPDAHQYLINVITQTLKLDACLPKQIS